MEGLVNNVAIEDDLLFKIDDHEKRICEHDTRLNNQGEKIHGLEVKNATYDERFNSIDSQFDSIKTTLVRFEGNYLQSASSMTNLMTQIFLNTNNNNTEIIKTKDTNNAEVIKTKDNNRNRVVLKGLAILGGVTTLLILGYFAGRGIYIQPVQ